MDIDWFVTTAIGMGIIMILFARPMAVWNERFNERLGVAKLSERMGFPKRPANAVDVQRIIYIVMGAIFIVLGTLEYFGVLNGLRAERADCDRVNV